MKVLFPRSFRAPLLAALVAFCSTSEQAAPPNVLLLSVDTLRADHLGCYGYEKPTSPNIDSLATQSLVFDNAVCEVPLTAPSMSAMLTGKLPRDLGLTRNGVALPSDVPTVAERFQAAGYATWCIQSNWTLKADLSGVNRGFAVYRDDFKTGRWSGLKSERIGDEVAELALEQLQQSETGKPFFAWVHFSDPHAPYVFRDEYNAWDRRPWRLERAQKVRVQYDAEVRFVDEQVGKVLNALPENTLVVFVADHGESLYEHGYLGHGRRLYQPGLRIPWMIRAPGVAPGRSNAPIRGADMAPTLLALAGLPPLENISGVNVLGSIPQDRIRIVEAHGGAAVGLPGVREAMANMPAEAQAVLQGDWKLIQQDNKVELYNLREDPAERSSQFGKERARAEEFLLHLKAWNQQARRTIETKPLSDADVDALRALGYID